MDLKQVGGRASKRYVCRMAEEVRAAVKANPDVYERLLELNEDLFLFIRTPMLLSSGRIRRSGVMLRVRVALERSIRRAAGNCNPR